MYVQFYCFCFVLPAPLTSFRPIALPFRGRRNGVSLLDWLFLALPREGSGETVLINKKRKLFWTWRSAVATQDKDSGCFWRKSVEENIPLRSQSNGLWTTRLPARSTAWTKKRLHLSSDRGAQATDGTLDTWCTTSNDIILWTLVRGNLHRTHVIPTSGALCSEALNRNCCHHLLEDLRANS